jgi:hypothetical protein
MADTIPKETPLNSVQVEALVRGTWLETFAFADNIARWS